MPDLTILVPLDGSKPAELSLSLLAALKPLGSLRVRLLSVIETDPALPAEREAELVTRATDYLDAVAARAQSLYGVTTEQICRTGAPYAEILAEAERPEVDLVLMTTHGRTSYDPESLGSVVDKVVRGTVCPILLVGPHASVPLQIQLITVPLDGSRLAEEALPVARAFAERLGSRLRLVRAPQQLFALDEDAIGRVAADVVESVGLTCELYLKEARLELGTSQPVETAILSGPPAEALLRDVKENPPDLVIMTSHGRHGFIRWALGSVTDRLIRGPVPVLVLRPVDARAGRLTRLLEARDAPV